MAEIASYQIFFTFFSILVLQNNLLTGGIDNKLIGIFLIIINFSVLSFTFYTEVLQPESIDDLNYLEKDYLYHLAKSNYKKGKGNASKGISVKEINDIYEFNMNSILENNNNNNIELIQFKKRNEISPSIHHSINPLQNFNNNRDIDSDDEI